MRKQQHKRKKIKMTYSILNTGLNLLLIVGSLLSLYGLYFLVIALVGLKKPDKSYKTAAPKTRFAVIIAARNEEAVIGDLLDSLNKQNYPKDMYTVFCAPNNCTDNTKAVAQAHGATIFEPTGKITGKGQVLNQFCSWAMEKNSYDYICVFDADNLAEPNFLQKMNDAAQEGVEVGVGYRDSKNPADSAIASCSSIGYWMLNRFYNKGRQQLSLSGLVHGCGFIASLSLLQKMGGWNTYTMTEDYEFSAQCLLSGTKVQYVAGAIFFDEQPLTFNQHWKQYRRWTTGYVQCMVRYLPALLGRAVKQKSMACLDLALTFLQPVVNAASMLIGLATALLCTYKLLEFSLWPFAQVALYLLALCAAFVLGGSLVAYVTVRMSMGEKSGSALKGVAYFSIFSISRCIIAFISLFKKQKKWDAIAHTRALNVGQMG